MIPVWFFAVRTWRCEGILFTLCLWIMRKMNNREEKPVCIRIPDTIVDRICAARSTIMEVTSESFHECSVDADRGDEYGNRQDSVDNKLFAPTFYPRKRYLLNTMQMQWHFLREKQHTYLYGSRRIEEIQNKLDPYIRLLIQL